MSQLSTRFETRLTPELVRQYTNAGFWRGVRLWDIVEGHARRDPRKVALVDERGQWTYAELLDAGRRLASGLLELGVTTGDVVSIQLSNRCEFAIAMLAVERIGAVLNPLTTILRQRELAQILRLGGSRLMIVQNAFRGFDHASMALELRALSPSLEHVVVIGDHAPAESVAWADVLQPVERGGRELDEIRPDPNSAIELAFTSGTTGEPKGVLHTHNTTVCIVASTMHRQQLTAHDVVLASSPVGHQAGYLWGVRVGLQAGATIVFQESWDAEEMVRLVEQHRVTFTMAATTFLIDLLNARNFERHDLRSLRNFTVAGSNVPPSIAALAQTRLPGALCRAFGMTEQGHTTATDASSPRDKILYTDGSPQPEMQVKIVDDAGNRLGTGQEGHLRFRGPFNFVGYIQGRAFTAEYFDAEDFFDTGDLASLDADGYIRITGRAKDLIVRGGEKVPVKEIEDLLMTYPGVAAVAVVAVADPRLGERAVACVRTRGQATLTLPEIQAFLEERKVTRQFWPEGVALFEELPMTPAGKIQKYQLRAQLMERPDHGITGR